MTSGKLSQNSFLPSAFVAELQTQARRYATLEKIKSRREWKFGELVNCQWDRLDADVKAEISREMFYVECSRLINDVADFPIVSASGETLRRWCEVAAAYQNMPGLEIIREQLSFDHFRRARILANKGKVIVPSYALAVAATQGYTAEEMATHFDPPQAPNEFERVTGWIDSLQAARFEWLARDKRERLASLLGEIRKILE
jgi:hypothetical protein